MGAHLLSNPGLAVTRGCDHVPTGVCTGGGLDVCSYGCLYVWVSGLWDTVCGHVRGGTLCVVSVYTPGM